MANGYKSLNNDISDFLHQMEKREGILATGRGLQEFGRRIVYRREIDGAFADLSEKDQERVRAALTQLEKGGDTDA